MLILCFCDAHLFGGWEPDRIFRSVSRKRWYYHSHLVAEGMRYLETDVSLVHFGSVIWNDTVFRSSDSAHNIHFKVLQWVPLPLVVVLKPASLASRLCNPLDKSWIRHWWHRAISSVSCHSISVALMYTVKQPFWFLSLLPHSLFIFHLLQQVKQKSYEQHPSVHFN